MMQTNLDISGTPILWYSFFNFVFKSLLLSTSTNVITVQLIPSLMTFGKHFLLKVSRETVIYGQESSATLITKIATPFSHQRGRRKTKRKAIVRQKKGKREIWSLAPKACPTPRRISRLTSAKTSQLSSTQLNSLSIQSQYHTAKAYELLVFLLLLYIFRFSLTGDSWNCTRKNRDH
jgi:hypothetical protein